MDPLKKKRLGIAVRAAFTLACLGYLAVTVPFRDLLDAVKGLSWGPMGLGLACLAAAQPLVAWRWRGLLAAAGVGLPFGQVFRLHLVGLFFNITMPGATGGDLVKSYAVARRVPGRGTAAVVTVFLDRVVGMTAMFALAGGMALLDPRFAPVARTMGGILGCAAAGVLLYLSPLKARLLPPERIRALRGFGGVLAEVDRTVALFRERKAAVAWAFVYSLANHASFVLVGLAVARSLGIPVRLSELAVLIPVVSAVSSLPISVMGFGVGEMAYVQAFEVVGVAKAQALALSLLTRFSLIALGLAGGLAVLADRRKYAAAPQ